jgi:hypothetical protein
MSQGGLLETGRFCGHNSPMLWIKITHLVIVVSNAFVFGLLFARWSAGKWSRVYTVQLIGFFVMFLGFMTVIIRDDF